jgi:hypothetical protein
MLSACCLKKGGGGTDADLKTLSGARKKICGYSRPQATCLEVGLAWPSDFACWISVEPLHVETERCGSPSKNVQRVRTEAYHIEQLNKPGVPKVWELGTMASENCWPELTCPLLAYNESLSEIFHRSEATAPILPPTFGQMSQGTASERR